MNRFRLAVDQERCWGCKACEAACKQENPAPFGVKRIRVLEEGPRRVGDRWEFRFTVARCLHCDDPACAAACPEGAIAQRSDGVVVLDEERCTGCRACEEACPYEAVDFDPHRNVAVKCNLCHHRLDAGLEPACAGSVCLARCIRLEGPGVPPDR
ncbi:4Fe-4S dicluster domain-containing protein [Deferrisoma camini]|uniref:4Fe-4S dicluster domain-containing protein n=1 Tax=Deferrisoma camini TaxID=1035120 RepID=UPI00046D458F|nr:4Fe-4S dicluster domain-containing protein [Deferrisoma camini]